MDDVYPRITEQLVGAIDMNARGDARWCLVDRVKHEIEPTWEVVERAVRHAVDPLSAG